VPLEYFDDTEYDLRTPADWLQLGASSAAGVAVPARAFMHTEGGSFGWHDATVMGFNEQTSTFEVVPKGSATALALPRILTLFLAEDPDVFVQRLASAHALRKETEALLRYNLAVDCMPPDAAQALDGDTADRLARRAHSAKNKMCVGCVCVCVCGVSVSV
jgi:dynein heavy chain